MADYTLSAKITGDSSGFEKAFSTAQKTLDAFEGKIQGFAKKLDSASNLMSSIGNKLTCSITKPAIVATSALAGMTLVKGFNRLTGIDDARAKLQGLGHTAENVESIMNNALESVKGTSYGLDEAATTAAGAVAAGVAPGKALTRYLSLTADAAAIAGTSMADMGSIINKVQTSQVAYTDNLNQLADSGLPIYQWLADAAGVTAAEVKEMASEGEISSAMFLEAIEKNIGGAAKTIGENSFKASLENIGASISRIGANFLDAGGKGGGFFSQLKPLMSEFNAKLSSVEEKAADLGVKFGDAFGKGVEKIRELKMRFDSLPKSMQGVVVKAVGIGAGIAVGIGPALKIMSKLTSGISSMLKTIAFITSPVGIALVAIAALAAGFAYLMSVNESFRGQVISVWNAVSEKIRSVIDGIDFKVITEKLDGFIQQIQNTAASINFDAIAEKVQGMVSFLSNMFSGLNLPVAAFVGGFIGILAKFSGPLATFSSQVLTVGSVITKGIGSAVPKVIPAITNFFNVLWSRGGVIGLLKNGISGLGRAFAGLLSPATLIMGAIALLAAGFVTLMATNENFRNTVINLGSNILSALIPAFQMIGQAFGQIATTVLPVFISLFNQLLPILGQIITVVLQVAAALAPMITQLVGALLPVITNIITVVMNIVTAVMPAAIAIINVIISVIQTMVPIIMDILSVVISVVSGIISAISPIVSFIGGIIVAIIGVISPIITWIANAIATVIQVIGTIAGAVSGIFSTVFSIISGIFSAIVNFISVAINAIASVISTLTGIVGGVFNGIYSIASSIMGNVRNFIIEVFNGIKSAWNGLTAFVSGVFSGIGSAVNALVGQVKGFVNGVIGGINAAIGLINKIPGVSIGKIPYLLHGTDDWQGGFARMNEGGRGELTYLPDGSRVIPHDISVRYAKEAARSTAYKEPIDMSGILEGMTIKIVNNTNVDGTPLREACSSYVIEKIGRQQRAVLRAKGAY